MYLLRRLQPHQWLAVKRAADDLGMTMMNCIALDTVFLSANGPVAS